MLKNIAWNIDLTPMINQIVSLETKEGHLRRSKLTEVRFGSLQLQGQTVEYPTEIVLDGDDPIAWVQIRHMEIAVPAV